jgi:hypothetical protein
MSRRAFSLCFVAASMVLAIAFSQSFLSQYKALPYHDSRYSGGPQKISERSRALTMTWAVKELRIMTPIHRITAGES